MMRKKNRKIGVNTLHLKTVVLRLEELTATHEMVNAIYEEEHG